MADVGFNQLCNWLRFRHLVLIDTLARTITASEIPISVLTALLGAPIFIVLLRRTGGNWR